MNLHVHVDSIEDEYQIKLTGEIDIYTVPILEERMMPLIEEGKKKVTVNLHDVSYMDSSGLGTFISAYKRAQQYGCAFEIVEARDRVLRLFIVTGLNDIIALRTTNGGEV